MIMIVVVRVMKIDDREHVKNGDYMPLILILIILIIITSLLLPFSLISAACFASSWRAAVAISMLLSKFSSNLVWALASSPVYN